MEVSHRSSGLRTSAGFTLVEILVAMAILLILMSAVFSLFVGSLRATQTSYQQMDAFERARGTLTVVENDIVSSFSSRQNAQLYNFYGTPIGMTFVGVSRSEDTGDFNIARITYVVYNQQAGDEFLNALEDVIPKVDPTTGNPIFDSYGNQMTDTYWRTGYPYALLRYVEPNVGDIDSFRFNLDDPLPSQQGNMAKTFRDVLCSVCQSEYRQTGDPRLNIPCGNLDNPDALDPYQREFVRAKKCEMWIRMLAGGDTGDIEHPLDNPPVPINFWHDPNVSGRAELLPLLLRKDNPGLSFLQCQDRAQPGNYVVTENILSIAPPWIRQQYPFGVDALGNAVRDVPRSIYFDYDYAYQTRPCAPPANKAIPKPECAECVGPLGYVYKQMNSWWNDARSLNGNRSLDWRGPCLKVAPVDNTSRYVDDPRLPEIVQISFWLMFASPYPGAPDFKREFSLQICVPTGYQRKAQ